MININLELCIARAKVIANNNKYGYSQTRRDEEFEDDCSSGTVNCLNAGGFNFSKDLRTDTMLKPLLAAGFVDVTKEVNLVTGKGLLPADVCLKPKTKTKNGHVVLILKKDGAEIFQYAGDFDGKRGDSSGKEILIKEFYNSGFKYALRYVHATTATLPMAAAPLTSSCPYTEPATAYKSNAIIRGNDARWFEWQLFRIGYKPVDLGCLRNIDEHGTDGTAAIKVWKCIHYEQQCARLPIGAADESLREHLKSVPTR